MKIAAIQSSFIPWRGYFDFIASVDAFVIYDDVQYSKNSWRNRNKIKTSKGVEWLTVPVLHKNLSQLITETYIQQDIPWSKKHLGAWNSNYRKAPFYSIIMELLGEFDDKAHTTITELNSYLIRRICNYLEIKTPIILSNELSLQGRQTHRLIDLLKKLKATSYLSGPVADIYLDKKVFMENGIALEYKSYDYTPYPQLWGEFIGEVTVLDLIANCGPDSKKFLRSRSSNIVVL